MCGFVSVKDRFPEMKPGLLSETVIVIVHEFGTQPSMAIANCWKSSQENLSPKWYLSRPFYRLDHPVEIGGEVTYWSPLPTLPAELVSGK
jgi:hypothetical protein